MSDCECHLEGVMCPVHKTTSLEREKQAVQDSAEVASLRSALAAAQADNAALREALGLVVEDLECAYLGKEPPLAAQKSHAAASIALSTPSPGAQLLADRDALSKRVEALAGVLREARRGVDPRLWARKADALLSTP